MSTYNQNFRPEPYFGAPGPRRNGRRRSSIPDPRFVFRRRMAAMLMLGIFVAPIVWATRDDGKPVGVAYTGGAAAVVQFDASAGQGEQVTDAAPPTIEVPTSPPPQASELVVVDEPEPTAEPVEAPAVVECLSYTVQQGDSWYGIAERAGVKAGVIAGRNGMTLQSSLLVGSEICLPPGATLPPVKTTAPPQTTQAPKCSGKYTVRTGDSWSLIASRHSVTATALASANNKTVKSTILIGEVLCLPVGAKAPATTQAPAAPSGGAPAATPSPGGASRSYTRAELEQIVRDAWPDELEKNAFYVVNRESRWVHNVKNSWPSRENPCCYGLFQINWTAHKSWLAGYGVTSASQLFDPVINSKMAYVIYQRAGSWKPWWTDGWRP